VSKNPPDLSGGEVNALVLLTRALPRWAGAVLVMLYAAFVAGGFVI
jgi:hypothetical protein